MSDFYLCSWIPLPLSWAPDSSAKLAVNTQWTHSPDHARAGPGGLQLGPQAGVSLTLPSRQGRPPLLSCLPMFAGHRDDVETCGRWTHPSPPPPITQPRGEPVGTHRSLALSLSSTCGKTPLSSGHNPRRQAGSGRRRCSTSLGNRPSHEQSYPSAPGPTKHRLPLPRPSFPLQVGLSGGRAGFDVPQPTVRLAPAGRWCPALSSAPPPLRAGREYEGAQGTFQQLLNADREAQVQVQMPLLASVNTLV